MQYTDLNALGNIRHQFFSFRYRQSRDESDAHSSYDRVQKLDDYHGLPSGIFACDEHLAGKMPSRGK
jgi:hypothetical protein